MLQVDSHPKLQYDSHPFVNNHIYIFVGHVNVLFLENVSVLNGRLRKIYTHCSSKYFIINCYNTMRGWHRCMLSNGICQDYCNIQ